MVRNHIEEKVMNIEETLANIKPLDQQSMDICKERWDSIAKPLHSLGKLEDIIIKIAGMTGNHHIQPIKKALVPMCADNGVVKEGVTQSDQEVTALVSENFLKEKATASIMCKTVGADIFPVDIGIAVDTSIINRKIAYGTQNMAKGPAMTRSEAISAIEVGISMVEELMKKGYKMIATGEMGIGNTTTSSAMASVLLNQPVEIVTGRGAGLSREGLRRKVDVIKKAIKLNRPDPNDAIDVLAKVGGLDIAGIAGLFLGGAALNIPVVVDGFISAVGALAAANICPEVKNYMLASHMSKEPASQLVLEALELSPCLQCDMCLGEGTGAVAFFPLIDLALAVYQGMSTFGQIDLEAYVPLD